MYYSLEETLKRPIGRTLWSRWQLDIINFLLRRVFDLGATETSTPIKVVRVLEVDMSRPSFSGVILWVGGFDEPLNMGQNDIHLAEV